jgi:hypothetical protein
MTRIKEPKLWAALGFGLLVGLANAAKPVHIDDTLYLEVARRIVTHPLDPYGGILNWQQVPERTYNVSISPPLLSYWFAFVMTVAGENIALLHVSMIPWLLLACWALYRLAERWSDSGLIAVLLVVGGPAVTVGMNLMLDVPLLACVCASVEFLARGGGKRSLLAAAAFAAAGVWIKFAALALVPVFLVAALTRRRLGPAVAAAGPVAALVGWQLLSRSVYGTSQVGAGMSFLAKLQSSLLPQTVERTLTMTVLLAMTFPVWLAVRWRGVRALGAAGLGVLAAALAAWLMRDALRHGPPAVSLAFVAAAGVGTFGLAAVVWPSGGWRKAEFDPRLWLATWIASGAAIVILFGPFVAVRSFLPIEPALAIWLLGARGPAAPRRLGLGLALGVTLVLSVLLFVTDLRWAGCYPDAARAVASRYGRSGHPIDFLGHWGWQYYAERAGFRAWDARRRFATDGTLIVIPLRADKQWIDPAVIHRAARLDRITVPPHPFRLTTWNRRAGFRFYGGDFGQLPWGFSDEPTEQFSVHEVGAKGPGALGGGTTP